MKGSARRDSMLALLAVQPMTAFDIEAQLKIGWHFVRQELSRMERQGRVRKLVHKRLSQGRKKSCYVYELNPDYVAPPSTRLGSPTRMFKPKPRKPTVGSGQHAAPCISRSLKWDTDWVSI